MRTQAKSAGRALDIVEALAGTVRGLSFTELQRTLAVPKSSLHELLAVLVERGYVECDPLSRQYSLGIRIWESGQAFVRHHGLVSEAQSLMQGIVDKVNETVQLAVLDGLENVYLAKVDCSHPLRLQSEVGKRLPAHATGLGKALLAYLEPEDCAHRLHSATLARYTEHTLTDINLLLDELSQIRQRGFAVDNQEYTPGLCCVAVPIYDHAARFAAMSVSIPLTRATAVVCAAALSCLATASCELSRRLGITDLNPVLLHLSDPAAALLALDHIDALRYDSGLDTQRVVL